MLFTSSFKIKLNKKIITFPQIMFLNIKGLELELLLQLKCLVAAITITLIILMILEINLVYKVLIVVVVKIMVLLEILGQFLKDFKLPKKI